MATPQGRRLGYHAPEQVSNQEPPDSRPCVITTTLLGGVIRRFSLLQIHRDHRSAETAHGPCPPPLSLVTTAAGRPASS